jgi:hypothetical protein
MTTKCGIFGKNGGYISKEEFYELFKVIKTKGDGTCFYQAFASGLALEGVDATVVRKRAGLELCLKGALRNSDNAVMVETDDPGKYCQGLQSDGFPYTWADDLIISTLSKIYKVSIVIFQELIHISNVFSVLIVNENKDNCVFVLRSGHAESAHFDAITLKKGHSTNDLLRPVDPKNDSNRKIVTRNYKYLDEEGFFKIKLSKLIKLYDHRRSFDPKVYINPTDFYRFTRNSRQKLN